MGRFTNPRDLYFGEGARHEVKNLKGSKATQTNRLRHRDTTQTASMQTPAGQALRGATVHVRARCPRHATCG